MALAEETIAKPLIKVMREKGLLRQGVLYPGCFVSFDADFKPTAIRVCEINIRPGRAGIPAHSEKIAQFGSLT